MTDIAAARLHNQRIAGTTIEQPEAVVRWMGALQAQDYGQAVWAVGLRTKSATLQDVEQALASGKIIRTWPMRGTLHFVPPEDAKWMLQLSAARMLAAARHRHEQINLNEAVLEQCKQVFYDALQGGRRLSRPEMMTLLERAGISTLNQRGYHILSNAALTGLIYMGPMQDKQQTFALLDELVPHARTLPRDEALAALARRYFTSHGPASLQDFAWWAGLPLGEARKGLAEAKQDLITETLDGKDYWRSNNPTQAPDLDPDGISLLPGFDEYLLGYTDRSAVLAREHSQKIAPGSNGIFRPMLVIGGQVVGTWSRTIKENTVAMTLQPFVRLNVSIESLFAQARRYASFLGLPISDLKMTEGE